ncbi:hypothetical protein [Roseimicrobium gellanilyticum]|nr:hypothetical protein [Roseimicrobium gellanilyticum]
MACAVLHSVSPKAPAQISAPVETTLDVAEPFRDGVSLVWSPNGQAAWDSLKAYHKVDKIVMRPRSVTAETLDAFKWDQSKVLPPDTLIFAEDDTPEFRERVRTALRKQVGENAARLIEPYEPPTVVGMKKALIVTSFVARPKFPSSFIPDTNPKRFRDRKGNAFQAYGFGTQGKHAGSHGDNVRVLADDLNDQFALRFTFYTGDDRDRQCMVLSTPGTHQDFESALKDIKELLGKERIPMKAVEKEGKRWRYTDTLSPNDELWLPDIHATTLCEYPDLSNKRYLESGGGYWILGPVKQLLNMRLNHEGALVETTFVVPPTFLSSGADKNAVPVDQLPLYPKRFIFDRPFIASFWREGADWPYLACWIDGPEMLTVKK